jgi:hypothetical protein
MSKEIKKDNRIEICEQIAADAKTDAEQFDGQPFTGKTMAEYMGYHGAAISALANLIKSILEEQKEQSEIHTN